MLQCRGGTTRTHRQHETDSDLSQVTLPDLIPNTHTRARWAAAVGPAWCPAPTSTARSASAPPPPPPVACMHYTRVECKLVDWGILTTLHQTNKVQNVSVFLINKAPCNGVGDADGDGRHCGDHWSEAACVRAAARPRSCASTAEGATPRHAEPH